MIADRGEQYQTLSGMVVLTRQRRARGGKTRTQRSTKKSSSRPACGPGPDIPSQSHAPRKEPQLIKSYLGEVLLQFGPPTLALILASPARYVVYASPLFSYLLLRYASGVPPLETKAEEKWGKDADWQAYRNSTGVLFPGIGKGVA